MVILFGCVLTHVVMAGLAPSPWWVPDLTLIGLILGIVMRPQRWLPLSLIAGLFMSSLAVRFPEAIFASYVVVGVTLRVLATEWQVQDVRVETVATGTAAAFVTLLGLWLDRSWSLAVLGMAGGRVALTCAAMLVVRWLMGVGEMPRTRAHRGG